MYEQVLSIVEVAFLVVWVEPGQQPVLYLPKQQGPTAWITVVVFTNYYLLFSTNRYLLT